MLIRICVSQCQVQGSRTAATLMRDISSTLRDYTRPDRYCIPTFGARSSYYGKHPAKSEWKEVTLQNEITVQTNN